MVYRVFFGIVFQILLVFGVVACQKGPNDGDDFATDFTGINDGRWSTNTGEPTELQGEWSGCRNASGIGSRETLTFQGNEVEYAYTIHASLDCRGPLLELIAHGSFEIGDATDIPANGKKITLRFTQFYATPRTQNLASSLNTENACGINQWQSGRTMAIATSSCSLNEALRNLSQTNYSVFTVVDGATIFLGEPAGTLNALTEATRPDHFYSHGLTKTPFTNY